MKSLIDFDKEYMKFAAVRLQGKTEFKDDELEQLLNDAMREWLSTPLDALGGKTPDGYFDGMSAEDMTELLARYCAAGMAVPEPLYRKMAGDALCVGALAQLMRSENANDATRATAMRLICDIDAPETDIICVEALGYDGEAVEIAADRLKSAGYHVVDMLSEVYEIAYGDKKALIMDILSCYPGVDSTADRLIERLYNDRDRRAYYAILAGKLGDERLLEPLMRLSQLTDMEYYDYKEIVNAIDALGGDPGVIREFYGDPDYEALRVADTMPAGEDN